MPFALPPGRALRSAVVAGMALALVACEQVPRAVTGIPPEARARAAAWLAGDTPSGDPPPGRPAVDRGLRNLGAEVYRLRCVPCHGVNGNGRGLHAPRLAVPPRDFTTGVYELRSTPSGSLPTDADLFRTISRGVHGSAMIPWDWLPAQERWAVIEHVKSFSPRFAAEGPGDPVAVPPPPPETPDRVARGEAVYVRAGCPKCHGPRGDGDGPSAPTLRRDGGQPIRPRPFAEGRFLRGGSPSDLFLTLATGLDGTPMPAYDALPPDDLWDLAAWVRSRVVPAAPGRPPDAEEALGVRIDVDGQ